MEYLMLACIWRAYGVPHVSLYMEDIWSASC